MARAVVESLEARQLLNADWITVINSSDPPQQIWEGESAGASYEFDTTTPYLIYNVHYDDGKGGTSDSWTLSGGGSATYDDNGTFSQSLDLFEDQGWDMQSIWHQDWTIEAQNAAPHATLVTDYGDDSGSELITLSATQMGDASWIDAQSLQWSWSYSYAGLGNEWSTNLDQLFDASLDNDGALWLRVKDKDNGYSDYCTTLANMPTIDLYGNQVTSSSVQLNWLDTADGETSWIIQRADDGGSFSTIKTLDGHTGVNGAMSWVDDTCDPETRYIYRLRAAGNGADTPYSPKKYVTTLVASPSGVAATETGANTATVEWADESNEEDGYNIYRSNDDGMTWTLAGHTGADATSLAGVPVGSWDPAPLFKVRAFIGAYNSPSEESSDVEGVNDAGVTPATPTVTTQPPATISLSGTDTTLDVLGSVLRGESYLTYTWSATSVPSGADDPVFDDNGTNAGKDTTATFFKAGEYHLVCTIDNNGASVTSNDVVVTVVPTFASIDVDPGYIDLTDSASTNGVVQQLQATPLDQFGDPNDPNNPMDNMPDPSDFAWSTDNPSAIVTDSLLPHSTGLGLNEGDVDPYWTVDGSRAVVADLNYLVNDDWGSWDPDTAHWISFAADPNETLTTQGQVVSRTFGTVVTLDANNLSLSGNLAVDSSNGWSGDTVMIMVNGQTVLVGDLSGGSGGVLYGGFSLSSADGLFEGVNTIEFRVDNVATGIPNATGMKLDWDTSANPVSLAASGVSGPATMKYVASSPDTANGTVTVVANGFSASAIVVGPYVETIGTTVKYNIRALPTSATMVAGTGLPAFWISPLDVPDEPRTLYDAFVRERDILAAGIGFWTVNSNEFDLTFASGSLMNAPGVDDLAFFNCDWSKNDQYSVSASYEVNNVGYQTSEYDLGAVSTWQDTGVVRPYNWGEMGHAAHRHYTSVGVLARSVDLTLMGVPDRATIDKVTMHVTCGRDTADFLGVGSLSSMADLPPVQTRPATPTNLTATLSGSQVILNWNDNSDNETGFVVERQAKSIGYWVPNYAAPGANAVTITLPNEQPGETYSYRIYAVNDVGTSEYSNPAVLPIGDPTPPQQPEQPMPETPPQQPEQPTPQTPPSLTVNPGKSVTVDSTGAFIIRLNNDDDDGDGVADWKQGNTVKNENDLVPLYIGGSGYMTLRSTTSRKAYRVWKNADRSGGVIMGYGKEATAKIAAGTTVYVEGRSEASASAGALHFLLGYAGGATTKPATANATVQGISVKWVPCNDSVAKTNLDANPHLGGGKRIFPDKDSPSDTLIHNWVYAEVTVTPAPAVGTSVHLRSLDVDDPNAYVPGQPTNQQINPSINGVQAVQTTGGPPGCQITVSSKASSGPP